MKACPTCGRENPDDSRFCNSCGSPLVAAQPAPVEERKLVTVLFADLVGFTSRSEQLDPEDVRAMLSPYYSRLRSELERRGGTVEKFIGDAVMAVFGAPVAHEDDPERAIRAALAIRDWVREDQPDLQVRIAVTTGEALVSLGARPAEGEGMVAGDVVNTAARLQTAAPVNGILAGERTYRATRGEIEYREADPVAAKGKVKPVPAWEVVEARSRLGVDTVAEGAPLVGRDRELALLRDALDRVRDEESPQLVTLVGVPGMGKSRLVYELSQIADAETDLIMWRQGRSLPYGDGVTYWALGEMVKAHCGILDTDPPEVAASKLIDTVSAIVADESVLAHLRPLVGLGSELESGREHQAWRRFFEALAAKGPLVLVFEDLHWADDSLLDFIDHLVDWAISVPLLVVCTARPELLERRPAWGGGKRNASTLSLSPLSEQETARLVARLMDRSVLPAATQEALLTRVGGNPLYTEQYVHMLVERGDEEFPLPENVQGIIAARLDGLAATEKALLQAASVFGKVFWRGAAAAVAIIGDDDVDLRLHALERKEFIHRERRSSVADETEYVFGHLLVRDVAYSELPRATRAAKHRAAAEWIESLGRSGDLAEMLAHHYQQALEYMRAAGDSSPELEARTRDALRAAGDRAFALGALRAAAQYYTSAAELTPRDDPSRPRLLLQVGRSRPEDRTLEAALLEEAVEGLLATGDTDGAAEAETRLATLSWVGGSADRVRQHMDRAAALVDHAAITPERAQVLVTIGRLSMLAGDLSRAVEASTEALRLARELDRVDVEARALMTIGTAKGAMGDRSGIAELEHVAEICDRPGLIHMRSHALSNLSSIEFELGDVRSALEHNALNLREAEAEGDPMSIEWSRTERAVWSYYAGDWSEAEEQLGRVSANEVPPYIRAGVHELRVRLLLARGEVQEALVLATGLGELARGIGDPQVLNPSLGVLAETLVAARRRDEAGAVADESLAARRDTPSIAGTNGLVSLALALMALGRGNEIRDSLGTGSRWFEAVRALVDEEFERAAELFDQIGNAPDEARARLLAASKLLNAGRTAEGMEQLERAEGFYRRVGATAYLAECEALGGRGAAA